METIVKQIKGPVADLEKPLQFQVTNIDYSEYVGRIGIDEQRDLGHERRQRIGNLPRARNFDAARRAGPEHEADRVRAGGH